MGHKGLKPISTALGVRQGTVVNAVVGLPGQFTTRRSDGGTISWNNADQLWSLSLDVQHK